jgi:hypothetical protein
MRRRAIIGALLLIGVGVVLGATVFRTDIAQATGLAQAVSATIVSPLDAQGNVKVHEQGTANVNVTNSGLSIAPPTPVTGGGNSLIFGIGDHPLATQTASALSIHLTAASVDFLYQNALAASFLGPGGNGNDSIVLSLARPIKFDEVRCNGSLSDQCSVSWVGALP